MKFLKQATFQTTPTTCISESKEEILPVKSSPPRRASELTPLLAEVPPRRKSKRQKVRCGVCSLNGFDGDEMWMLRFQGAKTPSHLLECPTSIPQHLICFQCCPRNKYGCLEMDHIITHRRVRREILTEEEFCKKGNMKKKWCKHYAFVTASETDYSSKITTQGKALLI